MVGDVQKQQIGADRTDKLHRKRQAGVIEPADRLGDRASVLAGH